jgi:2-polyprenyl-3-methyl-5-hydroxy-6-metoxy-1,4-benzoquinol methylase
MDLNLTFDAAIMSDVIEHLSAPGEAVETVMSHLAPGGRLYITTPNPTGFGIVARTLLRGRPNVYYDHVTCFLPEHLQALCDRYNFRLADLFYFTQLDRRSLTNSLYSGVTRVAGELMPRVSASLMAVIQRP